ncbi:hypothetical protein NDU88_001820 [Pleurodeles waltl]|uniref:Uncharacterized protein n=1 Tax=Pleurodeles waltl TaxID=8319 RepID=A0AAV7PDL3_PLEWA|nr:hypothetical protein NDU88_001820 [Pleurodeles waltl]
MDVERPRMLLCPSHRKQAGTWLDTTRHPCTPPRGWPREEGQPPELCIKFANRSALRGLERNLASSNLSSLSTFHPKGAGRPGEGWQQRQERRHCVSSEGTETPTSGPFTVLSF